MKKNVTSIKVKLKAIFNLEQATKTHRGSRAIALLFNLGAKWCGWSMPSPEPTLRSGKNRYPFYRRLIGPQSRYGRNGEISSPPGFDLGSSGP